MRFRRPQLFAAAVLGISLLGMIACLLLAGCRYAEVGTVHVTIPKEAVDNQLHSLTINQTLYTGDVEIGQGKSVPVKALSDLAASAAQTGDPTANLDDSSKQEALVAPKKTAKEPAAPLTTDNEQTTTD